MTGAVVRAKDSFKGVHFKRYRFRKVIKDVFRGYVYVLSLVFLYRPRDGVRIVWNIFQYNLDILLLWR